jgi:hypothetical protein
MACWAVEPMGQVGPRASRPSRAVLDGQLLADGLSWHATRREVTIAHATRRLAAGDCGSLATMVGFASPALRQDEPARSQDVE